MIFNVFRAIVSISESDSWIFLEKLIKLKKSVNFLDVISNICIALLFYLQ